MKGRKSEDPAGNDQKQKVEVGTAIGKVRYKRSANLNDMMKDGAALTEDVSESSSLELPEAKGSKQEVEDYRSAKTKCISALSGQGTQDRQSAGSGDAKHESEKIQRMSKSKKKKDLNLPRRASKRLAGIEVDTVPELKASTRARRKQSDNSTDCALQQPEKQDFGSVVQEEYNKTEEKSEAPPDSPLADFFTDPCIAFAIKTLKDHSGNEETENMIYEKQECNFLLPPGNLVKQDKHDGIVGTGETSGSSMTETAFGSSWPDPCIEFAIKTLTGAIPVEYDPHIEEYFQKKLGSSQQHKDNRLQKEIS